VDAAFWVETDMLRTIGVLAVGGLGVGLFAMGGQVGSLDLANVPLTLVAFAGVSALVLIGLRYI
jgi:hypothetical protein